MIDRATIDKIMDAANIVDVVSDFVTLKRAGANLKGLCPFHDDRTPSFMVSPAKNYCKCFACGKGGNPVGFIMEHEQISYPDALRYLAKKYGIAIQEKEISKEDMQRQDDRESMFIVNQWANEWFQQQLFETEDGRNIGLSYFYGRGFRDDIIRKFQLGYCPNRSVEEEVPEGNDSQRRVRIGVMSHEALKAGYKEQYLTNDPETGMGTGLSLKREKGGLGDRFWGRVIFPIFTMSGKVVGFGGRVLDAATKGVNVKYQNSPESIIYSKKRELYGLFQAKQAIRKHDLCFLVEGYTDVMAMHQSGIENVVASSGTALTDDQIRLIHRLTDNITVIYDGDAAGIKASQRGIDMLLAQGMNVRLLLLPDGDDPDSFARKHNAEEYQRYLSEHQVDFIKFKTNLLMVEAQGDPVRKSQLVNNIVQSIACIPNEITRAVYVQETAATMQMQERLIARAVSQQVEKLLQEKQREREHREHRATGGDGVAIPNDSPDMSGSAAGLPTQAPPQEAPLPQEPLPTSEDAETDTAPFVAGILSRDAQRLQQKERELMRLVVRYGEKILGSMPDSEGEPQPVSVSQYIHASLASDGLELTVPLHRQLLDIALEARPEVTTEHQLINFPDPAVSALAFELATDPEQLSRMHQQKSKYTTTDNQPPLTTVVNHIVSDYKLEIVTQQKRQIMRQLQDPAMLNDPQSKLQILTQYKSIKEVEKKLSEQEGRVIV